MQARRLQLAALIIQNSSPDLTPSPKSIRSARVASKNQQPRSSRKHREIPLKLFEDLQIEDINFGNYDQI